MSPFILAIVFVTGALYVVAPLLDPRRARTGSVRSDRGADLRGELLPEKEALYDAIRDLDFEYETGKLSEEDHAELRRSYRLRALRLLDRLNAPTGAAAGGAGRSGTAPTTRAAAFCHGCGTAVGAADRFCAACGAPVRGQAVGAATISRRPVGSS